MIVASASMITLHLVVESLFVVVVADVDLKSNSIVIICVDLIRPKTFAGNSALPFTL